MKHFHLALITAIACCVGLAAHAQCPPPGETVDSLTILATSGWNAPRLDDAAKRNTLAIGLLDCLASPNPHLRDDLAFEGLQTLMRKQQLDAATMLSIRTRLLADLAAPTDAVGFKQPFAALTLAEVVRADRIRPFLLPAQRDEIVERASAWLASVRDYRGFDEREGWRHSVAHGADLMVQLAVHPLVTRAQAETMLGAIAAQVMPAGHAYVYGEGERLMAPVFYLARRGWFTADDWQAWLGMLVAKLPPTTPFSQAGLAARHNLGMFVNALYVSVQESGTDDVKAAMLPGLKKAIRDLG